MICKIRQINEKFFIIDQLNILVSISKFIKIRYFILF